MIEINDTKRMVIVLSELIPVAINIKPLLDNISKLERLAKIGEATEKAFEDGKYITDASCKTLSTVDDLLEWVVEND